MDITSLLFPLLILLLFIPIFLSGRRQRRQMQEMRDLQNALEPGDIVVTTSGLRATVVDASYEDTIDLEIADGIVTTWVRAAVREKVKVGDESVVDDAPIEDAPVEDTPAVSVEKPAAVTADKAAAVAETPAPVADPKPTETKTAELGDGTAEPAPTLEKNDSPNGTARS
ncbi:preprotein translocase subunit YajC [Pseudonocardia sp. TRM90224]|uniref:preprotein translocase subunit YajC n=1 Tax=Pseudonocardia sp. TRM90224 TaxID=2812678 RepID=UPI001E402438|nr:preprotein translocase subunit YajC [Pseudonocardia sp. TRM90224]